MPSKCIQFKKQEKENELFLSGSKMEVETPYECKQKLLDSSFNALFIQARETDGVKCVLHNNKLNDMKQIFNKVPDNDCNNYEDTYIGNKDKNTYYLSYKNGTNDLSLLNKVGYINSDSNFNLVNENKVGNSKDYITIQQRRFDKAKMVKCEENKDCYKDCLAEDKCRGIVYKNQNGRRKYFNLINQNVIDDLDERVYDKKYGILMKGKTLIKEGFEGGDIKEEQELQNEEKLIHVDNNQLNRIKIFNENRGMISDQFQNQKLKKEIGKITQKIQNNFIKMEHDISNNESLINYMKSNINSGISSLPRIELNDLTSDEVNELLLKVDEYELTSKYYSTHGILWILLSVVVILGMIKIRKN